MRTAVSILLLGAAALAATNYSTEGRQWWAHVQFLADDRLEGRNTGTRGYDKAAQYVARQFRELGLKPAGTHGYFQKIKLRARRIVEPKSSLELLSGAGAQTLKLGEDAYFNMRVEPDKQLQAPAVFVGYGLRIPELNYDDLAGLDLKGKIAVYIAGAPANLRGPVASHYQSAAERWKILQSAGAIGTASFSNPKHSDIPWSRATLARLSEFMSLADPDLQTDTRGQRLSLTINPAHADLFLAGTGHTVAEILTLDDDRQPLPKFPLNVSIRAHAEYRIRTLQSENVAAILPGDDPNLANEYVVMSAHLDHLGIGRPVANDSIYNGAMDDASGVASLIEVARELARAGALHRSILFLAVTGEEKGLLGSRYFTEHPTVNASSLAADLNLDMFLPLFPLRAITVYGVDESDLGAIFKDAAGKMDIRVEPDREPQRNIFIRSDQYNFIRHGVPAVSVKFAAAEGSPEEAKLKEWIRQRYHAPSDDLNQPVDLEAAAKFNQLIASVARTVANQPARPQWHSDSFFHRFAR